MITPSKSFFGSGWTADFFIRYLGRVSPGGVPVHFHIYAYEQSCYLLSLVFSLKGCVISNMKLRKILIAIIFQRILALMCIKRRRKSYETRLTFFKKKCFTLIFYELHLIKQQIRSFLCGLLPSFDVI